MGIEMQTVMVTDCHTRTGCSIVRDLLRHGYKVVALGLYIPTMCSGMKNVIFEEKYPDPFLDADSFVQTINHVSEKYHATILMLCKEEAYVASFYRASFNKAITVMAANFSALIRLQDKSLLKNIFNNSIQVPKTLEIENQNDLYHAASLLKYPFIVKPIFGSGGEHVVKLSNEHELTSFMKVYEIAKKQEKFIAQPFINGEEIGYGGLIVKGKIIALCGQKSYQGISSNQGLSTIRTTYTNKVVEDSLAATFFGEDYTGAFMIDLLLCENEIYAIDLNPRYWGSVATAIDSGVALPTLHIDAVLNEKIPSIIAKPTRQIESHWLAGNIKYLFLQLSKGNIRNAFKAFSKVSSYDVHYSDFGKGLYKSFLIEMAAYLKTALSYGNFEGRAEEKNKFFWHHRDQKY